jgi:hypothetical protein
VVFDAPVKLSGATTTINASLNGDITFVGSVNGTVADTSSLVLHTLGTGLITTNGQIGTVTRLLSFTADGATILTGDTTVDTATTITFTGTVDGDHVLTLNAGTTISLGGTMGGVTPLGGISLNGTGIDLGSNIYTNNSPITTGSIPITLTNNVILNTSSGGSGTTGGDITIGSNVDSSVSGMYNLTLQAGGSNIVLSGALGGSTSFDTLTLENANNLTAAAITVTTLNQANVTGTATYNGAIITTGAIDLSGNNIALNSTVHAGSAITFTHLGTLTITALVKAVGEIMENGGGTVLLGGPVSTDPAPIVFNSPVVLTADLTGASAISTGAGTSSVTFNNTIDGAHALEILTGTATFTSAVGATTQLTIFQVNPSVVAATAIYIGANQSVSSALTMNGPVILTNSVTFLNTGAGEVNFASVNGSGVAAGVSGYELSVISVGSITFTGDIMMTGGAQSGGIGPKGGDVLLESAAGNITVANINTSGSNGTVSGGNAGIILIQPSSRFTTSGSLNTPVGVIIFNGNLTAVGGTGGVNPGRSASVELAFKGRAQPMSYATMYSINGNGLTITCGSLIMGFNEAMTVFGSTSVAADTYAILSDMVSSDAVTISSQATAPSNAMMSRPSVLLQSSAGSPYTSPNTHLLARTAVNLVGAVMPPGLNVGTVSVGSRAEFEMDLQYEGQILNYDTSITPPPPPPPPPPGPPPPASPDVFVDQMGVAESELQDLLPLYWKDWQIRYVPKICPEKYRVKCEQTILNLVPAQFNNIVFLPENRMTIQDESSEEEESAGAVYRTRYQSDF